MTCPNWDWPSAPRSSDHAEFQHNCTFMVRLVLTPQQSFYNLRCLECLSDRMKFAFGVFSAPFLFLSPLPLPVPSRKKRVTTQIPYPEGTDDNLDPTLTFPLLCHPPLRTTAALSTSTVWMRRGPWVHSHPSKEHVATSEGNFHHSIEKLQWLWLAVKGPFLGLLNSAQGISSGPSLVVYNLESVRLPELGSESLNI